MAGGVAVSGMHQIVSKHKGSNHTSFINMCYGLCATTRGGCVPYNDLQPASNPTEDIILASDSSLTYNWQVLWQV